MKTSTTTKTAAAWLLLGGGAALIASALLGNPFETNIFSNETFSNQVVTSGAGLPLAAKPVSSGVTCNVRSKDGCAGKKSGSECTYLSQGERPHAVNGICTIPPSFGRTEKTPDTTCECWTH